MHARSLSIVIVTYNSRDEIDACLGSLVLRPPRISHDVVVIDNASPDDTAAHVRARWPMVRVIDAGANVGFARANNLAIQKTTGELVLLLNPDTRVRAGAIDGLVGALVERPDIAIAGPRIVDGHGVPEVSFGSMISPLAELKQKVLTVGNARGVGAIRRLVRRMTSRARTPDWVSGACLLARRVDLEAVGLLDERYFMYGEDVDLCAAVRARGRGVLFTPDVEIEHLRGRSAATAGPATARAYRESQLAFYQKHHPRWVPVLRAYLKILRR